MTSPTPAQELRKLAMEATPKDWHFERHSSGSAWYGNIIGTYGKNEFGIPHIRTISCLTKYGPPAEQEANARFAEAANPSTILALLDALEEARKQNATMRGALEPFAAAVEYIGDSDSRLYVIDAFDNTLVAVQGSDFRRAKSALATIDAGGKL